MPLHVEGAHRRPSRDDCSGPSPCRTVAVHCGATSCREDLMNTRDAPERQGHLTSSSAPSSRGTLLAENPEKNHKSRGRLHMKLLRTAAAIWASTSLAPPAGNRIESPTSGAQSVGFALAGTSPAADGPRGPIEPLRDTKTERSKGYIRPITGPGFSISSVSDCRRLLARAHAPVWGRGCAAFSPRFRIRSCPVVLRATPALLMHPTLP